MENNEEHIAVFLPPGSSSYEYEDPPHYDDGKNRGIAIKSYRSRSIRRCWNRLSRLQKSFIIMMLSLLVIFSFFSLTIFLTPIESIHQVAELGRNSQHLKGERESRGSSTNRVNNNIPNPMNNIQKSSTTSSQKPILQHQEIPEPETTKIPTVATEPPGLPRNERAEKIRGAISLDPVIPYLNAVRKGKPEKENKPEFKNEIRKKLKFNGPENVRQTAVVEAFLHSWNGYKQFAWGKDHLKPVSGNGDDWFGLGLTLVDSLDTMYIMGLDKEFFEARDWVEDSLHFNANKNVNLFETTIRVLGGLLSAYHLSDDKMFIDKAKELGDILVNGFKSKSGIPYSDINLKTGVAHGPTWNPDSTTSEVSTIQLEFRDLSRSTNFPLFEDAAMNVSKRIHLEPKKEGLVPIFISPLTGSFKQVSIITLGARGDSYYEYLLKQWIQTGKKIDFLRDDYLAAVLGMKNLLLKTTNLNNLTYLGELHSGGRIFEPKMDHLVCYLPGTLALGVHHGLPEWHLKLAKDLLHTCYETYRRQPTGLAPEITFFNTEADGKDDFYVKPNDAHNLLRPETIESLWYLKQVTGDAKYEEMGWEIFNSFLTYTKVAHGFSSISSVLQKENVRPRDVMESFFLGETLKYFYLLFSHKPIFDLNDWVFNTEAHPLPVYKNAHLLF